MTLLAIRAVTSVVHSCLDTTKIRTTPSSVVSAFACCQERIEQFGSSPDLWCAIGKLPASEMHFGGKALNRWHLPLNGRLSTAPAASAYFRSSVDPKGEALGPSVKGHINGDRDALRDHLAGRAADQSPTSRAERVLGLGVCTGVVKRLVRRPGVRVRDIDEPRVTEEVGYAHRTRSPDHPSRTSEILGRTRDIGWDSVNAGEADEASDVGLCVRSCRSATHLDKAFLERAPR